MIFTRIKHFLPFSENQRKGKMIYTERGASPGNDERAREELTWR
jgi:hypothetical protein